VIPQTQFFVQGVQAVVPDAFNGLSGQPLNAESDLYVVANQFGSQFDQNEFQVLGTQFQANPLPPDADLRVANLNLILNAAYLYEAANGFQGFFELANFDDEGNPLLSWRVHLLPHLGYDNLYQQFNLDEPWNKHLQIRFRMHLAVPISSLPIERLTLLPPEKILPSVSMARRMISLAKIQ